MSAEVEKLLQELVQPVSDQVDLIPPLHAQLGHPSTALAADLDTLRVALVATAETHVTNLHRQVMDWVERCEAIERDCFKLAKSLGSFANTLKTDSSASIADMRKIPILPERYARLQAHHENLTKFYHSKVNERNLLTSTLITLSRTLGKGFYTKEVLAPVPIPNQPSSTNPMQSLQSNVNEDQFDDEPLFQTRRDVSPDKFAKLQHEIDRGKAEITRRLQQLSSILESIVFLHSELDIPLPDITNPDSSYTSIQTSSQPIASTSTSPYPPPYSSISADTNPVKSRPESSTQELMRQEILARYLTRMAEAEDEEFETLGDGEDGMGILGVEGIEPSLEVLAVFLDFKEELERMRKEVSDCIQSMYDQLETLWKRLDIPEAETDAFVEEHRGLGVASVRAYEDELQRMHELKRESIGIFVMKAKEDMEALWSEVYVGEEERNAWYDSIANEDPHSDEVLLRYEEETKRRQAELQAKRTLLAIMTRYMDVLEDERKLLEAESDKDRFARGAPRDPGRLLREEKWRRRATKEKPKIEQDLARLIPKWEEQHNTPFLVNGERILDRITAKLEAVKSEGGKQRSRAGAYIPARSVTPSQQSITSSTSSTTSSKRPSSAMADEPPPAKRARLGSAPPTRVRVASNPPAPIARSTRSFSRGLTPGPIKAPAPGSVGRALRSNSNGADTHHHIPPTPISQPDHRSGIPVPMKSVAGGTSIHGILRQAKQYGSGPGIGLGSAPPPLPASQPPPSQTVVSSYSLAPPPPPPSSLPPPQLVVPDYSSAPPPSLPPPQLVVVPSYSSARTPPPIRSPLDPEDVLMFDVSRTSESIHPGRLTPNGRIGSGGTQTKHEVVIARVTRKSRRESFKPRSSVGGIPGGMLQAPLAAMVGGATEGSVKGIGLDVEAVRENDEEGDVENASGSGEDNGVVVVKEEEEEYV